MKQLSAIFLILLLHGAVLAQKSEIEVITSMELASAAWSISDRNYQSVFDGSCSIPGDTVRFTAASGEQYYLRITIPEKEFADPVLLTLLIDGTPVIKVENNLRRGDHFLQFYTGIRQVPSKIVGGTPALISDFPWQVYIQAGDFMCGGSIIANNWILTAAHCVSGVQPADVLVKAGATNPYNFLEGKVYQVNLVTVHEDYNSTTLENDLALIRLKTVIDIPNALPIRLLKPEDDEEGAAVPGVMTWVTGWGLTDVSSETYPDGLQKVELPIVSRSVASVVWRDIPDNFIMAGYRSATKDACSGDSGGPMVVSVSGEYRQAGIVSWGSSLCNTYSGFTQVSAFIPWIETKTGLADFKPPVPQGDDIICPADVATNYFIPPVPGATSYTWEIIPSSAGTIAGNTNNALATWNHEYTGDARIKVRVVVGGVLSEWSRYDIRLARETSILIEPLPDTICAGDYKKFDISTDGTNLNYKWYRDGNIIYSGIKEDYEILNAENGDQGIYMVEVSGLCGSLFSDQAELIVLPVTNIISVTPDTTALFGSNVMIKVKTEGHNLKYVWKKDGITLQDEAGAKFLLENISLSSIGIYSVTVSGSCGTLTSDNIYLFVTSPEAIETMEVKVWPGLVTDVINIAPSNNDPYNILIYNSSGHKIKELKNCRNITSVGLENNSPGLYIVSVYNVNYRVTRKVIKN